MAAGLVTLTILDGTATSRTARFWSSDGTTAGLLFSPAVIVDGTSFAPIDFSAPVGILGVNGSSIATVANPFPTKTASTSLTDGSTTITAGGTAQNAFAAAAVVNGYEIVNPDPTEDMWVSDTTTAAANATGSIRVAANGGAYSSPPGMAPSAAVSVVAATTGHKFTARRW